MFSEAKVTEIYCLADDFCKEFARHQENYMLKNTNKNVKHRNKPNRMSDAEIMIIMILFHSGGYRCFKHFYLEYVCKHLAHQDCTAWYMHWHQFCGFYSFACLPEPENPYSQDIRGIGHPWKMFNGMVFRIQITPDYQRQGRNP